MTSLSSSFNLSSANTSPFLKITDEISSAVQAGVLDQADATALDSALSTIDAALSDSASDSSTGPVDMKSKVDSLISQQVATGKLSQDQAKDLEAFFAQGPAGAGGPSAQGGQDAGTPSGTASAADASTSTASTDAASSSDQYQALLVFLQNLKTNAAQESGSYSIGQSSTASSSSSGTLFSTSA